MADSTRRHTKNDSIHTTRIALLSCLLVCLTLSVWAGIHLGDLFTQPDASHYLDLADGAPTMLPFASRQLAPLLVRAIHFALHLSIEHAFLLEGLVALAFFQGYIGSVLIRSRAPWWMVPATLGLFFWTRQLNGLVFPDLVYAALLSGFLLLFGRQRLIAAALLFFPLMIARESTLLTLACFLIAGRHHLGRRHTLVALASAAAGLAVVYGLTRNALPNSEHIAPGFYLFAKTPWNLLKNVFGISLWTPVYPSCAVPEWQTALPFGSRSTIGFCGFNFDFPLNAIAAAVASFGLLPLLLLRLKIRASTAVSSDALVIRFCILYGGLSFVLAPLLGELFFRLFDFGWPLFLVALPLLIGLRRNTFSGALPSASFLTLHLALAWSPLWLPPGQVVIAAALLGAAGWALLAKCWTGEPASEAIPTSQITPLTVL